ncbi:ribonuclease N [Herbidospora sp. NEAU-GS84]|uniref:Ribonuclease N n=1 Tax=Herbidospora solisilvae TaxID=2696284 RepID=A0A7C9MXC9_9ACTN|nr:ribonuclease N [Herbidospora solisilvae]
MTTPHPHGGTVPTPQRPHLTWPARLTLILATLVSLIAVNAPAPAQAAVYSTCTQTRCADARTANTIWKSKGYPTSAGWYTWTGGLYNYTGGRHYNREGQLPTNATYYEYDVYPRPRGAARDAYRIVVNRSTGATWFTPDHYANFYRL